MGAKLARTGAVAIIVLGVGCNAVFGIPEPELVARAPLSVVVVGAGQVTDDGGALSCAAPQCSQTMASYTTSAMVTLHAQPAAGALFAGWLGDCAGPDQSCTLTVDRARAVTAQFVPHAANVAFIASEAHDGNLGGLAGADAVCNRLAAAAHLEGTFVALLSTSTTNARDRLVVPASAPATPARGFIRPDGLPVADTVGDLLDLHRLWYPVVLDENGRSLVYDVLNQPYVWTGSEGDGRAGPNHCADWTRADYDLFGLVGISGDNVGWVEYKETHCLDMRPTYCVEIDRTAPVAAPSPVSGKRIYVTNATVRGDIGYDGANAACAAEKPAGVAAVRAVLLGDDSLDAYFDDAMTYVRPDGIPVGVGVDLKRERFMTGVWVHGDGSEMTSLANVWTGVGYVHCKGWSSASSSEYGGVGATSARYPLEYPSFNYFVLSCAESAHLYCLEQ
jgi:hypothetical protein